MSVNNEAFSRLLVYSSSSSNNNNNNSNSSNSSNSSNNKNNVDSIDGEKNRFLFSGNVKESIEERVADHSESEEAEDAYFLSQKIFDRAKAIEKLRRAQQKSFQSIICTIYLLFFIFYLSFSLYSNTLWSSFEAEYPLKEILTYMNNTTLTDVYTQSQIFPWISDLYWSVYNPSGQIAPFNLFVQPLILQEGKMNYTECKNFQAPPNRFLPGICQGQNMKIL